MKAFVFLPVLIAFSIPNITIADEKVTSQINQPAQIDNPQTEEKMSKKEKKKKPSFLDKVQCRKEAITGTRLKKIVTCRTLREWKEIERGAFKSGSDLIEKPQASEQSRG